MIKGALIDLDGVIYNDSQQIPGADAAVSWLDQNSIPYRFITNTTMKSRASLSKKLSTMGVRASVEKIFSAAFAGAEYLRKQERNSCRCLIEGDAVTEYAGMISDSEEVDYVVAGDPGENVTLEILNQAFRCLLNGAELIALQKNRFWLSDRGYSLDAGAFAAMLEFAANKKAKLIGKPSKDFFMLAVENLGLNASQIVMIGDDLESDIFGAGRIGIKTCLVKTGKFLEKDLADSAVKPDWILPSIAELPAAGIFSNK